MSDGYRILICAPEAVRGGALMSTRGVTDCEIVWCDGDDAAIAALDNGTADIALVYLPSDGHDLALLDRLCEAAPGIPLMVATSRDAIDVRILALNRGAVDYLIWPFNAGELLARVATVLRRREISSGRFIRRGDIVLDCEIGRIGDGLSWTTLSPTERKVFPILFGDLGRPVSKQRMRSALAEDGFVSNNAIEVLISRLRVKARAWGMQIQTYRGLGYTLESVLSKADAVHRGKHQEAADTPHPSSSLTSACRVRFTGVAIPSASP